MDYQVQGRNPDVEHLQLLAIFHYVLAGLSVFFSFVPAIYMAMGVLLMTTQKDPGAGVAGGVLIAVGLLLLLLMWTYAALLVASGRSLQTRHRWMFCVVMAAISCLNMPFGTILGVFTLVVLMRPSVKDLFELSASSALTQ